MEHLHLQLQLHPERRRFLWLQLERKVRFVHRLYLARICRMRSESHMLLVAGHKQTRVGPRQTLQATQINVSSVLFFCSSVLLFFCSSVLLFFCFVVQFVHDLSKYTSRVSTRIYCAQRKLSDYVATRDCDIQSAHAERVFHEMTDTLVPFLHRRPVPAECLALHSHPLALQ